ncbi:DNA polymerase alpha subunit B [Trichomonascus vanleenenianus]|uniref:DNA-directed DNA polymerase alpha subunit POL12 n=1 Tax=Trichomonascus vanleenenianus TaxID=2268995 RepID=UPI003ECA81B2
MTGSELINHFGPILEAPELQESCESLMKVFSLSAEELYWKWESYVLNSAADNSLQPSIANLRALQGYIQRELEKENQKSKKSSGAVSQPSSATKGSGTRSAAANNLLDSMLNTPLSRKRKVVGTPVMTTPVRDKSSVSPVRFQTPVGKPQFTPSTDKITNGMSTPFKQRKDAGKVLESLNSNVVNPDQADLEKEDIVKFTLNSNVKKYAFRTMYMKLSEAAEYFDERIESFIDSLLKSSIVESGDHIGNPATINQSEVIAVGRILGDSESDDQRLTSASVMLETCRRIGAGMRVRLNLNQLESYSLFPGQVVAVQGTNPDGKSFVVSKIIELQDLPMPATDRLEVESIIERQKGAPASVAVAAGPYTTNDNLMFEPLDDLISHIIEKQPHVAILMGPFLDASHAHVQDCQFDDIMDPDTNTPVQTLDDVFKATVVAKLQRLNGSATTVILVPHPKDVVSSHSAFPQQAFDRKSPVFKSRLAKNFKFLSNPSMFSLNDSLFAVSSLDVIRDMKGTGVEKRSASSANGNALAECAASMLSQRSLYPVFPSPSRSTEPGLPIDVPYMGLTELPTALPDVLITPSMLKPFASVVRNVVVINPGMLSKGSSGGTYAQMYISPPNPPQDDIVNNEVWGRARVDIIKL